MPRTPDVYVIESLHPTDEGNGHLEGSFLAQLLRMHGKQPRYTYVRTRKQFKKALEDFGESNYRYLHISAHGDEDGMQTTNGTNINYSELGRLLAPYLPNCRLFLSSCEMVHERSARALIRKTECRSVVGPRDKIDFHDAAIFWASLYHLMFKAKSDAMSDHALGKCIAKVSLLFDVVVAYYAVTKADGKIRNQLAELNGRRAQGSTGSARR